MPNNFKLLVALSTVLVLAACGGPGHVSGEGNIHSLGGFETATLKFNANSCDGIDNSYGQIKMADKHAVDWEGVSGVEFEGVVDSTYFCSFDNDAPDAPLCSCNTGYQEINFSYVSNNDQAPGEGTAIACMGDTGNSDEKGLNGIAEVFVYSGPYAGYHNVGSTNVTQHSCGI